MRVLVAGFVTIDTIQLAARVDKQPPSGGPAKVQPSRAIVSIGGPPCYAGLVCSHLGVDVSALTKVGTDFPDDQMVWLARNGIVLGPGDRSSTRPTTRFKIEDDGEKRTLMLQSRCEDLSRAQLPEGRFNASLVSPLAGEISGPLLAEIAGRSDFVFLDPQGFLRSFDRSGAVSISKLKDEGMLRLVDAVKMDREEAEAITGKSEPGEAFAKLLSMGIRRAIVTSGGASCYVLDGGRMFTVPVPKVQVVDSTGAGDILAGAAAAMYVRSRDFLWGACFGIAASSLSLHMIALSKVDLPLSVDDQARRLYSLASPTAFA